MKAPCLLESVLIYPVYVSMHLWMSVLSSLSLCDNFMGSQEKVSLWIDFPYGIYMTFRSAHSNLELVSASVDLISFSAEKSCVVGWENQTAENKQVLAGALLIFWASFYLKVLINYSGIITACYNLESQKRLAPPAQRVKKLSYLLFFFSPCYLVPAPATAHITKIKHNHSYWLVTYVKTPATLTFRKWHICNT